MNTRKSSPLPNPQDTINRYRIAYRIHYQNLHRHLLTKIYIYESQKNTYLKQFTKLAKHHDKLVTHSSHSSNQLQNNPNHLKEDQQNTKQKMENLYLQICQKESEINKLYQQSEGILLQLCDMVKSAEQDTEKIRQSNDGSNTQIRFLHHQSLLYNINEVSLSKNNKIDNKQKSFSIEYDKSRSIELNDGADKISTVLQKSIEFQKNGDKQKHKSAQIPVPIKEKRLNQTSNKGQIEQGALSRVQSQLGISKSKANMKDTEPEKITEERDEQLIGKTTQQARQETQINEQKQVKDCLIKTEAHNQIQSHVLQYSNIDKILNHYQKPEPQSWSSKFTLKNVDKNVIEINSSLQGSFGNDQVQAKTKRCDSLANRKSNQKREGKKEKTAKNKIKSCITILD